MAWRMRFRLNCEETWEGLQLHRDSYNSSPSGFVSFSHFLDSFAFCSLCLCDFIRVAFLSPSSSKSWPLRRTLDSRSRFLIRRTMAIPISGKAPNELWGLSLSLSNVLFSFFFFCRRMTLTADLLLLLYRMVRLETQKKSSFYFFILSFSLNLFLCVFRLLVGCVIRLFLRPRSIKNNSEYVGPNLLLFHSTISFWLVWLSPGEVDGKFRNGFQQWWIASFLRKQSPSPSAPGRQLAHKTTDKLCEKPRTDHQKGWPLLSPFKFHSPAVALHVRGSSLDSRRRGKTIDGCLRKEVCM